MNGATRILILGILATGCGRESTLSTAYLDFDRVAAADPLSRADATPPPKPPAPIPATETRIQALPARQLDFSENKARLAKVTAAVEESRNLTIREIARKLGEAYLREVDAVEAKRLGEVDPIRDAALAKAWSQVRSRFMTYADNRAPHAITVALFSGWPDTESSANQVAGESEIARKRQLARAQVSRAKLADLDADYERDVRKLLAGYDDEVADAITEIRVEIEKMRADAEARAQADALAQVAKQTQEIESVLSGKAEVVLPARPGRTAKTPAGAPIAAAPELRFPTLVETNRMRLEAVRSDAKIWAAHFSVRLVDSPRGAPDRTAEFIAWRKQRTLGP